MKQSTIDRYKIHTQIRYNERFSGLYNIELELSDDDYNKLCESCRSVKNIKKLSNSTFLAIFEWKPKISNRKLKKNKKNNYISCVFHKKTGLVKTVYPTRKKDYESIYSR